jgi:NAD(P)-dependent dehydrogenase (short-subunit alcohol dehydrogenase family)
VDGDADKGALTAVPPSSKAVALVTGAGTGFGRSTALLLAGAGFGVFGGIRETRGRNRKAATDIADLATEGKLDLRVVEMDVTNDESVSSAVAEILDVAGRIDVLVNNAGYGIHGPWELMTIDHAKAQFETNFFGAFRVAKAVVPAMRAQGSGTIIGISSDVAINMSFLESIYAASKWALEAMSLGMRYELQQFGIRVCVIEPGLYTGTAYDAKLQTNVDYSNSAGDYGPLVTHFDQMWRARELNHPDIDDVGRAVLELIRSDDPPFRTRVGCEPPRIADLPDEEYEDYLFEHFSMERFRRGHRRASWRRPES